MKLLYSFSKSEFKKFLLGKEQEYMNKKTTCNKTCSKIRTNYAKNKLITEK